MRLAISANGPGEFAGWVRPLLAALYAQIPDVDARVFCVPDDYATGREDAYVRERFPRATVYARGEYLRFALGGALPDGLDRVDRVQYLGGDLAHAARLHDRLGGIATSYKFSRRRYRERFARVFAVDDANRRQLLGWGVPDDRITVAGNLAIDGALGEADGRFGDAPSAVAEDGIVFFPGSRRFEVENVYPMFLRVAAQLRRRIRPDVPIVFARAPFTTDDELQRALATGGVPTAYGMRGTVERRGDETLLVAESGDTFPLVGAAMRAAARARLAVAIPGTKVIELAALGIPAVVCAPLNAPELAVINGPLQYAGRLPLVGTALKRAAVVAVERRFRFLAQPNMDAGRELDIELRGTVLPARLATVAAERYADVAWCRRTGAELRDLYAPRAGAADRIAAVLKDAP